uniref:Receptor ligand binding region domain-containing protein n=1 Tax=Ditylenchus dipsaci TaxID=166011 RepID=A0A915ELG6_9BILA
MAAQNFLGVYAIEFNIGIIHGLQTIVWRNMRHAVDEWNSRALAEKGSSWPSLALIAPSDGFASLDHRFCDVAQRELVALVVPCSSASSSSASSSGELQWDEVQLVVSMCNRFRLPCIIDRPLDGAAFLDTQFVTNIGLKSDSIGKAIGQLISRLMWNSFVLLYKQPEDVVEHIRERLRQTNIVVHTNDVSTIHTLLAKSSKLNMTETRYSYLFTNLDLRLLEDFLANLDSPYHCNISGIQLVKHEPLLKTELALALDSVNLIGEALNSMHRKSLAPEPEALLCDAGDYWRDGELFNDVLRRSDLKNQMTGNIHMAAQNTGIRVNTSLSGITRGLSGRFSQVKFFKIAFQN